MIITVKGQDLAVLDEDLLVSKSVDIYHARFVFDAAWDGFDRTAVFQLNDRDPIEVVLVNDECTVPFEVFERGGLLRVGVYGTSGTKVMPTIWGKFKLKLNVGTPTGSIGAEPTPSIYAQILKVANSAKDTADEAYEKAETAQDSARASAENAEAWTVGKRDGQDVPSTDETYHNNSKWWAESAQNSAENALTEAGHAQASARSAANSAASTNQSEINASISEANALASSKAAQSSASAASESALRASESASVAQSSASAARETALRASESAVSASTSASLAGDYAEQAQASVAEGGYIIASKINEHLIFTLKKIDNISFRNNNEHLEVVFYG